MPTPIYPPVRTFHARHGRLGPSARDAIERLLPLVDVGQREAPVNLRVLLPGRRIVIDFGSGMGQHALHLAQGGAGVLAIDVHSPGIARLALAAAPGIVLHLGDGVALLSHHLAAQCADEVHIMFPDPWPKARHAKRRLIQPSFLDVVARVLCPGGLVAVVTDDADYAAQAAAVIRDHPSFSRVDDPFRWQPTRYHERAVRLGRDVHCLTARVTG